MQVVGLRHPPAASQHCSSSNYLIPSKNKVGEAKAAELSVLLTQSETILDRSRLSLVCHADVAGFAATLTAGWRLTTSGGLKMLPRTETGRKGSHGWLTLQAAYRGSIREESQPFSQPQCHSTPHEHGSRHIQTEPLILSAQVLCHLKTSELISLNIQSTFACCFKQKHRISNAAELVVLQPMTA